MLMPRDQAAELGREAVNILEAGRYRTVEGITVDIRDTLQQAVAKTQSYPPDALLPPVTQGNRPTLIEAVNETTLVAARRFVNEGERVVALNFASATHPGGGFLNGARAQEESLARSSGLYACLVGNPMYEFHQARGDSIYTNYAIYSPDVPIIRTDDGELLAEPWPCSFITCPAPNAKGVQERTPDRVPEILPAMRERIHKILTLACIHGHGVVILGAWGCGAFGNDGHTVAQLFADAIHGPFRGVFDRIVFAITDWSDDRRFIGPFMDVFGG